MKWREAWYRTRHNRWPWVRLLRAIRLWPQTLVFAGVRVEEVASSECVPCGPVFATAEMPGVLGMLNHPVLITSWDHYVVVMEDRCPRCKVAPFDQFLPGFVTRWGRVWWAPWRKQARHAVICRACKQVVAWEWDKGEDA